MWGCSFPDVCIRVLEPYLCMDAGRCGLHVCVIDFSWDCFYLEGVLFRYCPNMRGA